MSQAKRKQKVKTIYLIKKDVDYWLSCKVSDEQAARYMEDNFGLTRVSFVEWLALKFKYQYRQLEKQLIQKIIKTIFGSNIP